MIEENKKYFFIIRNVKLDICSLQYQQTDNNCFSFTLGLLLLSILFETYVT